MNNAKEDVLSLLLFTKCVDYLKRHDDLKPALSKCLLRMRKDDIVEGKPRLEVRRVLDGPHLSHISTIITITIITFTTIAPNQTLNRSMVLLSCSCPSAPCRSSQCPSRTPRRQPFTRALRTYIPNAMRQ